MRSLVLAALLLLPVVSSAQSVEQMQINVACVGEDVVRSIMKKHGERPVAVLGKADIERTTVLIANKETGTWTLFFMVQNRICLMQEGDVMRVFPEAENQDL